eukprot:9093806-Pyramimonas_sp.AAC.1
MCIRDSLNVHFRGRAARFELNHAPGLAEQAPPGVLQDSRLHLLVEPMVRHARDNPHLSVVHLDILVRE